MMVILKVLAQLVCGSIGILFIVLAILQWVSFDYPDVNPFIPGAIFAPGMLSQLVNFAIVVGLASIGIGFFKLANLLKKGREGQ